MADGIGFKMLTEPFTDGIKERQANMPRAAMFAIRQAGREVRKAEKAKAPVLKGSGRASISKLQRQRKKGADITGAFDRPVPGLLKAGITASKNLTKLGPSSFSLKVGPRGPRAHLYAQKMERRYGYVTAGEAVARVQLQRIAQQAFNRVWKA